MLNEEVGLDLRFIDDTERHVLLANVAWITPAGAQGGKPAGIGVNFEPEGGSVIRNRIETHLAAKLKSTTATNTM